MIAWASERELITSDKPIVARTLIRFLASRRAAPEIIAFMAKRQLMHQHEVFFNGPKCYRLVDKIYPVIWFQLYTDDIMTKTEIS